VNARSDAARCPTGRRTAVSSRNSSAAEESSALTGRGRAAAARTTPRARRAPPLARRTERCVPRVGSLSWPVFRSGLRVKHLQGLPAATAVRRAPCDDARVRWSGSPRRGARRLHVQTITLGKDWGERCCAQSTGRVSVIPTSRRSGENDRVRHAGGRATSARVERNVTPGRLAYRRNVMRGGRPRETEHRSVAQPVKGGPGMQ
jgi:hypothetical protein